jgi:hypothetical protein
VYQRAGLVYHLKNDPASLNRFLIDGNSHACHSAPGACIFQSDVDD